MPTSARLSALTAILAGSVAGLGAQQPPLERINLPEGFSIHVYASGLENPRSMVLSPNGTLFVGSRITPREIAQGAPPDAGQVYAVLDRDGDQRADDVITLTQGLNAPNGVAFRVGWVEEPCLDVVVSQDPVDLGHVERHPGYEVLADDWLGADNIGWGRPVAVVVMPDGALLVSDDRMGVIYRIS